MKRKGKCTLTPKLRFPEFREERAWDKKPLSAALDYEQPGPFIVSTENYGASGTPVLTPGKTFILGYTDETDGVFDRLPVVIFDDFTTASKYVDCAFKVKSSAMKILSRREGYSLKFTFECMSLIVFDASQHKRYWIGEFQHLEMPFPEEAEQQRIAECLSLLDGLVAAEGRMLDVLKAHKKGLTQQLFPQPGQTQPRLRFPEFRGGPEWCVELLGDLFDTATGGTPDRSTKAYWGGSIPWITTSLVNGNVIYEAKEFISGQGLGNSSAKLFFPGTVLIALYGQGKTRGKVALMGIKAATNQACAAVIPREGIDPTFTFLNLAGRYDEIRGLSNSGGQENLSQGLVQQLAFSYPEDTAEQQRIVALLSSLGARVTAQAAKIDALKQHKRGLMQLLFPAPEEQ